jgi:hypothetical protein
MTLAKLRLFGEVLAKRAAPTLIPALTSARCSA